MKWPDFGGIVLVKSPAMRQTVVGLKTKMPEDYDRQIAEVIKRVRVRDEYLSGNGNCFSYRRDRRSVRDVLERPPFGFFAQDQNRQRRDHEGTSAERKHAALASCGQDQADDRWADQRTDAADC
jgi:hypothetical protein